jgi:hypothetical protein
MTATSLEDSIRTAAKFVGIVLLEVCVGFWLIRMGYIARGFIVGGGAGAVGAFLHGMQSVPADPKEWGQPRWGLVAMRYGAIALLTILLGLINKRLLREIWAELFKRRVAHPPTSPKRTS